MESRQPFLEAADVTSVLVRRIALAALTYSEGIVSAEDFANTVIVLLCEAEPKIPDLRAA